VGDQLQQPPRRQRVVLHFVAGQGEPDAQLPDEHATGEGRREDALAKASCCAGRWAGPKMLAK